MAVLQEQMSKSVNPFAELVKDDLAPAGTWVATIIDIRDQFGVVRPSYDNPQVMETLDQTTFLFGFRDQAGQPHRMSSKTMRISGNEKSNLFGFLKSALGAPPKYGWDYCEMKGKKVLLTVAHEPRRSGQGVYPTVAAICPVPAGFAGVGGMPAAAAAGSAGTAAGGGAASPAAPLPVAAAAPLYPVAGEVLDEPLPF
ncbi:MAG: hypothetical protein PHX41_11785 [Kiritimatiellae bacterium]|nr:hypothetical protein [Kiritimatiellia bacterium]